MNENKMKDFFKKNIRHWIKDESGQSTVEYVLLLLVIIIAINQLKSVFSTRLKGLIDKIFNTADSLSGDTGNG